MMEKNEDIQIEIPRSNIDDTVDKVFKISTSEEISELSNEFCRYYHATDNSGVNKFFAIIFENNFIPRVDALDFLSKNQIDGLNRILAYSVVHFSNTKKEHLVVIVDSYDIKSTLATQLEKGQNIKLLELENIVKSVNNILSKLQDNNIFCCNINPSNILMKDGKFYALREFIDTYPNFFQDNHYLAPELVECHQAARYTPSIKGDIYALGVSMFEAYTNTAYWNEYSSIGEYNYVRFEETTSKYLLNLVKLPENLRIFFKSTIDDDASLRWNIDQIKDWLEGKNAKIAYESITEDKNTISFNNGSYSTMKSLAYALYNSWPESIKFLKENKLFKWISHQQIDSEVIDEIHNLTEQLPDSPFVIANTLNLQKRLTTLLSLIDRNGCIREENIALSASSIPYFLHYLTISNARDEVNRTIKIIKNKSWELYQAKAYVVGHLSESDSNRFTGHTVDTKSRSITKSIERFIYALNPTLPCQSTLLKGKYVISVKDILLSLDEYVKSKKIKKITIDRHMTAFIYTKLDLKNEIQSAILPSFSKFVKHPAVSGLSILNLVQKHEPETKVPNLCKNIAAELKELFSEHLYNVEFKKQIIGKLENLKEDGNLEQIIQIFSDQQKFIDDYKGYYEACKKAKKIEQQINMLDNQNDLFNNALILGQKTTVLISYILCFIVTVTVII